jgi:hypothetical protein
MATIRFKPHYIKSIMNPKIIESGGFSGMFKERTTRTKPLRLGEKEIIVGVPPRPLYNQVKTGVFIEIESVEQKKVGSYTPKEMISDVGYYDTDRFLNTLNGLNKARTVASITGDSIVALHKFKFLECTSNIDRVLKEIDEINAEWEMFKKQNQDVKFTKLAKLFKEKSAEQGKA